jgi:hypothetical protein
MLKNKKFKQKSNVFKLAVENTPEVSNCYQSGLQALGKYSKKISLEDNSKCKGSLEIDECTRVIHPRENRWDFAIGYDTEVYFIEFHSAETGEVSTVLKKLSWLKTWLNEQAPELLKLKAKQPYFWVQSGRFSILKGSKQYRDIAKAGLRPISKLKLPV